MVRLIDDHGNSVGYELVADLLDCAAIASGAASAALVGWENGQAEIMAGYGLPLKSARRIAVSEAISNSFSRPIFATSTQDRLLDIASVSLSMFAQTVSSVPLRASHGNRFYTLTTFDRVHGAYRDSSPVELMMSLANTLSHQLRLIEQLLSTPDNGVLANRCAEPEYAGYQADPQELENPAVVTSFLLRTLQKKRRLLTRRGTGYSSVRTWRNTIKAYQVAAVRSAKLAPSDLLVAEIAGELVEEAATIVGRQAIQAVAAVPCGHSGPGCLSGLLGHAVAARLGVPVSDAFEPIYPAGAHGSSHPKTNVNRPRMKLRHPAEGLTLLVDDVATSGSHITEATRLLRAAGIPVVPIAWISG